MTHRIDPVAAVAALVGCDVASLGLPDAVGVTRRIRELRGWVDWFETQVTSHLDVLSAAGSGAPAEEIHAGTQNMSAAEARKRKERAAAAQHAPKFGEALSTGEVTAEHVDVLASATARLDEHTRDRVFDQQNDLLVAAMSMSPEEFRRRCRNVIGRVLRDEGIERAERQQRETRLSHRVDADGMHHLHGVFHPEMGEAVWNVIARHTDSLVASGDHDGVDRSRLAAHALHELVVGGHQQRRPVEAEITIVIDHDTYLHGLHDGSTCEYDDGVPLPPESVRRLACNGRLFPVVLGDNGVPLQMGREIRLASRAQRRALRTIYPTCAIPGCDTPFSRCEVHHIVEFANGGLTDLDNLIPCCSRHHHLVHELGWRLTLDPDRTLTITRADGTLHTRTPIPHLPRPRTPHRRRERADHPARPTLLTS